MSNEHRGEVSNKLLNVPYFKQEKGTTCGPACLRMATVFEGGNYSEGRLEEACKTGWLGNTCEELAEGAKEIGFESEVLENITKEDLKRLLEAKQPVIALTAPWILYGGLPGFGHFVVIIGLENGKIYYHDPDMKENLTKEIDLFFSAWEKYSFKGVKLCKSTKK